MWKPITKAPFGHDLEIAVIDGDGPHALVFPCRRSLAGWVRSETRELVDVSPTHWRPWEQSESAKMAGDEQGLAMATSLQEQTDG
ncbi:hypothetical protein [Rhizobium sp. RU36D]|uniref:hypothetical protein n=1 Tax=Rhizobium sp. RU36D TaxID=1907415 RepID=UPI0009D8E579|nr:hypothetical protein [Rhizobium sp. RU36D]SMC73279.1 hypothetical protein SAMN05880593_105219 [Rhizobium sp. RU36D]